MTLTAWPIDEHASDAQVIRQQIGSLIGAAGGLVATGGLELTQKGTPNMSVQIKGGTPAEGGLWIPGYTSTTGPTYFQNTATYEQVIEAAGASNPRVDTIVARIYDTSLDSSGKHEPVLQALRGAEESGVTLSNKKGAAAVPKNCYVLGYVLVPAKASSIVTADIKNVATQFALASATVTATALATAIREKIEHQYFTSASGGGGLVIEETVTTPAETLVTWQAFAIARSGATTEVGCAVKLLRNGTLVAETGGQFCDERPGPSGASQLVAQYVQAEAGTFTWKVELDFFGTSVSGERRAGLLAFT